MKRFIAMLLALTLLLGVCAAAETTITEDWTIEDDIESSTDDETLAGGWSATTMETAKGGETLKALFEKAVEGMTGVVYTPVVLLGTQIVSGMNYCILSHCEYTDSETADSGWCLVYLNEAFGGEVQVTNVVNIDIGALSDYGIFHQ